MTIEENPEFENFEYEIRKKRFKTLFLLAIYFVLLVTSLIVV